MTDAELIARFSEGHEPAFDLLVRRWQTRLYNFVLRYVGDPDDARDVCQQVFIRMYRKLGDLRDAELFSSWLYRTALNACHDLRKHQSAHPAQQLDEETPGDVLARSDAGWSNNPPPADAAAHARDLRDLLNRALQAIPDDQRLVVVMKEYEGLKFVEIAAILQIPANTAKSRLYYGLKALRRTLDDWGFPKESMDHEL
jgi:RNA polymerase sigma-70 factor, ECF subfamily